MNGRYLLDTNIIIALFADEQQIKDNLIKADEVLIPVIVIGELYFGARKSGRPIENVARIDDVVRNSVVLGCNEETAGQYGQIKNQLRSKGRPLPENDIWIAAIALQHNLVLVSRDEHFQEIDRLQVTVW
jgi:tRNA(fMet)-specific endonuclease VapC